MRPRKGNGIQRGGNVRSRCFGEHCALLRWALELGNTSFEPPGAGADDGIIVRGEFWMHRGHFLKEMKWPVLGQWPTIGH